MAEELEDVPKDQQSTLFYGPTALAQMEKEKREKEMGINKRPRSNKISLLLSILNLLSCIVSFIILLLWSRVTYSQKETEEFDFYGNKTLSSYKNIRQQNRVHFILYTLLLSIFLPCIINIEISMFKLQIPKLLIRFAASIIYVTAENVHHSNQKKLYSSHGLCATAVKITFTITMILWLSSTIGIFTFRIYTLRIIGGLLAEDSWFRLITSTILSLVFLITSVTGVYCYQITVLNEGEQFSQDRVFAEASVINWIIQVSILIIQLYYKHYIEEHTRCLTKKEFIQNFIEFKDLKTRHYLKEENLILENRDGIPRVNVPLRKS
uniref:Transmembrane protein n=1 Tax=Lepeophtheirus salmonis TaxID=72036 RepID=A0A0K2TH06_LEPSM